MEVERSQLTASDSSVPPPAFFTVSVQQWQEFQQLVEIARFGDGLAIQSIEDSGLSYQLQGGD